MKAYAWGGHEVDPKSPEALAKVATDSVTGSKKYWLARVSAGPCAGRLYDPNGVNSSPFAMKQAAQAAGRFGRELRPASREAFELYFKFICSPHSSVYLRQAERCY